MNPFVQSTACTGVVMMSDRSHNTAILRNCHYVADVHYTLQKCQWVLKPIGVWPLIYSGATKMEQLIGVGLLTGCYGLLLFVLIPSGRFIFFNGAISSKVKLFGPVGFCLSATIKYIYLNLKGTIFGRCIDHVESDWRTVENEDHRSIMLKYASLSRHLINLCAIFLFSGGVSYHTIMQFLSKDTNKNNATVKPLPYPGYEAFFDPQISPIYEIVFCTHFVTAMVMYTITTGAYSLAATFVTHIAGQIQIQMLKLEKFVSDKREKNDHRDPLAGIVREHVKILRFSKNVESALQEICLAQIVESTMNMCMLEYYCLMEWQNSDAVAILTYFTLLTSFTFNIFIFCYIGEILSEQCSQIGAASYDIDWYNLPVKKAHDLILISAISQYPPKLTAGKLIELSLNTFSAVLKSSVAYLNLLRTIT